MPLVHHIGVALQAIADQHADILTPREVEALYEAATLLWDRTSLEKSLDHYLDDRWEEGRFAEWSTSELAAQCRMQGRDNIGPDYSAFMNELSQRLLTRQEITNGNV